MGSMGNILFVVNCDLSEHDNLDDLERVVQRTREDLQRLTADPEIFAFSALYQLFSLPDTELNAKARGRLAAWQADSELTAYVDAQREAFLRRLQYKLKVERFSVQAGAHLGRLEIVLGGFGQWLELSNRLLDQDAAAVHRLKTRIDAHQKRMRRSRSVLKTALDGAVEAVKGELRAAVDRFFDPRSGEAVKVLMAVVTDPPVELADFADDLREGGFGDALYRLLQSYRQSVDQVMAESLNPAIIRFIREAEGRLDQMLEEVSTPHAEMVQQAVSDYYQTVGGGDAPNIPTMPAAAVQMDLDGLRRELGLQPPTAQATLDYSLQLRGEALVRFGWDRFVHWLKHLLRRENGPAAGRGLPALRGAMGRMRREMEGAIRSHQLHHRENIKFQYLRSLADAAGDRLYRQLSEQYSLQIADLAELDDQARAEDPRRADMARQLADLMQRVQFLGRCLSDHRADLEALSGSCQSQI
jgi:hypothetical protein